MKCVLCDMYDVCRVMKPTFCQVMAVSRFRSMWMKTRIANRPWQSKNGCVQFIVLYGMKCPWHTGVCMTYVVCTELIHVCCLYCDVRRWLCALSCVLCVEWQRLTYFETGGPSIQWTEC